MSFPSGSIFQLWKVTLFEAPDLAEQRVTLDIGQHRFFTLEDFNDPRSRSG